MHSIEVREPRGLHEVEGMLCLRYEIYCRKLGWIDCSAYPDGKESDQYDEHSTHIVVVEDKAIMGTIRLIRGDRLPIEDFFGTPSRILLNREESVVGEVSRLIVHPNNGMPIRTLCLGLIQALFRRSIADGVTHWYAGMDKIAYRVIRCLGFPLIQYAPAKFFMGSDTIPLIMGLEDCLAHFQHNYPPLYNFFSSNVEPGDVIAEATKALEARL